MMGMALNHNSRNPLCLFHWFSNIILTDADLDHREASECRSEMFSFVSSDLCVVYRVLLTGG